MSRPFRSWLAEHFDRFIALERAGGARYDTQRNLLLGFDRYLTQAAAEPPLEPRTVSAYLDSRPWSPRGRDNVVSVLWQALSHARRHQAAVEPLPVRPRRPPAYWRLRQPRIVSETEVAILLAAARALPTKKSSRLRPATTATLIGLLYTTGIRIGEALGLDVGDLDRSEGILRVVRGKFGKSRDLVLRESTTNALVRYINDPLRPIGKQASSPLFVSGLRRRLAHPTVHQVFRQVSRAADLAEPWPRPHDFRHTFAVRRVVAWYAEKRDVDSMLPALSAYLGHVSIENTRIYLRANGALLEKASERFARQTAELDEMSA